MAAVLAAIYPGYLVLISLAGKEIFTNRAENVNQYTGLAANGAVFEIGRYIETVPRAEPRFDTIDPDVKFTTHNICNLGVEVSMPFANGADLELDPGHQYGVIVAEQLAGQAFSD